MSQIKSPRWDRRQLIKAAAQLAAAAPFFHLSARLLQAEVGKTRRILFFTRSQTFEHSVIQRAGEAPSYAAKQMSEFAGSLGFEFFETKDGGVFDESLDQYHAIAMYTTGDLTNEKSVDNSPPMSAKGKQNLLDAVAAGKGFLGIHSATDTFHSDGPAFENQSTRDPFINMIGGEFIRHGQQQDSLMRVADKKFPGMEPAGVGFKMFEEWYALKNFAKDLHVLLVQETEGMVDLDYQRPAYPATWARPEGKGRVFYTSMGHREDVWTNPLFQAIVVGGMHWITGQVDADITPNIDSATPKAHVLPKAP
jgi:type 1 glutamine amidotransferase